VKIFVRNLQIFKRIGLALFVLTLVYTSLDQLLMINIDAALKNPQGGMQLVWFYGFFSLVLGIIFPILGILIVVYGAKTPEANEKGLLEFIQKTIEPMSIEILRSWGKTLLWSLLLLLPGLWKYTEYTLIPFVVALSPKYQRGEEDALLASARLVKSNLLKICAILTFFHLIFPSLLTVFFDDYRLIWDTPIAAVLLTLVDVFLFIFSTQLLLMVFESEGQGSSHAESYV